MRTRQFKMTPPTRLTPSASTEEQFSPRGYTDLLDVLSPQGSMISAQNVWNWQSSVGPRPRLQSIGTNPNIWADQPAGAGVFHNIDGTDYPVLCSKSTFAYYNSATNGWVKLNYGSAVSNISPSGTANDLVTMVTTYLPRADANLLVFSNGVNPLMVWAGPASGNTMSTLTQAPIAKAIGAADNRVFAWNQRYLSGTSRLVTRLSWSARGNPEDWTTAGSTGYVDLLDMTGQGTYIAPVGEYIVLATDREIYASPPFSPDVGYDPKPLNRTLGIPQPKAAITTPEGIFWLNDDFMVYRLTPSMALEEAGKAIQRTLHRDLPDVSTAFFGYHADAKMLTLYYSDTIGAQPQRGFTLNVMSGQWTPQKLAQPLSAAFQAPALSSSATTWGGFGIKLNQEVLTYSQMLGYGATTFIEAAASSTGTAYVWQHPSLQSTDDGQTVLEEVTFAPNFSAIPSRHKFVSEVRLDLQADIRSSLSVAVSGDMGRHFSESAFSLSNDSATSQYRALPGGVTGPTATVRIRSQDGGSWNLAKVTVRGTVGGDVG